MAILITGAAGFIGMHCCLRLLDRGEAVVGIDNLNDYYPVQLKQDRVTRIVAAGGDFRFIRCDFADHDALDAALGKIRFDRIIHLGAQAGVRHSIENPRAYVRSNLVGHLEMLELARNRSAQHLVYASSSSVYGGNDSLPFRVEDRVDHPLSLYAATKKADELMSETYAHLYRLPQTGLRFFTVYGPWGRPDMALWLFTDAILNGRPISVYNGGEMRRDFTYIDDIVTGVIAALDRPPADDGTEKAGGSQSPHAIYNIGNHRSEELTALIATIEAACGREAIRRMMPMQAGDVQETFADISAIERDLGFRPTTSIAEGVPRFVDWFRAYNGIEFMGFEMRRSMLAGLMLLALAGCGTEETNISEAELAETPQIASLEDYDLPVDKSAQITAIDAATGDASGMPRDGGAVVEVKKQEEQRPTVEQAQATAVTSGTMAIPEVAPPPPPPSAPALTVPLAN